eukprot:919118-Pelagomonas_calceolata.AAC.12
MDTAPPAGTDCEACGIAGAAAPPPAAAPAAVVAVHAEAALPTPSALGAAVPGAATAGWGSGGLGATAWDMRS